MAMEGPLAPWAPGMGETLSALGYTPRLVERHLHLAGGLSKFLHRRGLAAADVSPEVIERFVAGLRAKNSSWRPTAKSLSWLVDYLRQIGVTVSALLASEPNNRS
jgi:integrase/recombinase XerD